jgi:hypothetical protein
MLSGLDDHERAMAIIEPLAALAAKYGPRSAIAGVARVQAMLHVARDHRAGAEEASKGSLAQLNGLSLPFDEALTRLAYGAFLRRAVQGQVTWEDDEPQPFTSWLDLLRVLETLGQPLPADPEQPAGDPAD